jgi:hypothetical protein
MPCLRSRSAERSHCGLGVELRSAAMAMERSGINVRRGACTLRNYYYSRTLPRIIAASDSND